MKTKARLEGIYKPSEDLVARHIQGEFIIIPIAAGVGDLEEAIFTLNDTGQVIWQKLDGKKRLADIIKNLSKDFASPSEEIKKDVLGLVGELLKRRMIVEAKRA